MTELTTAPSGAPLADGDILLVRKAGAPGVTKVTAAEAAEYFGTSEGGGGGGGGGGGASEIPISARYWRLRLVTPRSSAGHYAMGFSEIKFLDAADINLVGSGTAFCSMQEGGVWNFAEAFDGTVAGDNGYFSGDTPSAANAYIGYDFGAAVTPKKVSFAHLQTYAHTLPLAVALDYSADNILWHVAQIIGLQNVTPADATFYTFNIEPKLVAGGSGGGSGPVTEQMSAKRWRVIADDTNSARAFYGFGEVQFLDAGDVVIPATGGAFIQSSRYNDGWDAAEAFDGDTSGFDNGWLSANGTNVGQWVGYAWSAPVTPYKVRLYPVANQTGGMGPGFVQFSNDDGLTWTTAMHFDIAAPAGGVGQVFDIPEYTTPGSGGGSGSGDWAFAPPLAADVTAFSGGGAVPTLTDDADIGLIIDNGANNTDGPYRGITLPIAASGDAEVTFRFNFTGQDNSYTAPAFGVVGDGDTRGRTLWLYKNGSIYTTVRWRQGIHGENGGNDGDLSYAWELLHPTWMRIRVKADNTVEWYRSSNGKTWLLMFSSDGNTTGRPEKFMLGTRIASNDGRTTYLTIDHLTVA